MSFPLLSIIVVSYNTKKMTLECLASVFAQTKQVSFELIVWDNASSDGSAEAISEIYGSRVRLVKGETNLGFAVANNRAAEFSNSEFLLLLNPDTLVLDGAIDAISDFASRFPTCGIWGGRTLAGDGSLDPSSCWGRQTLWSLLCQATGLSTAFRHSNIFNPEGMGGWNREGIRSVDIVCGCFLMIRRELWEALGGFREEFFMYGEEADLCLRSHELGARPMVTSQATIIHYGGASERVLADKLIRLLKAKRLLIEMHFPAVSRQAGKWLLFLWPVRKYTLHAMLAAAGRGASVEARDAWREAIARYREWWQS